LLASVGARAQALPNSVFWVGYSEAWFKDENYGDWLQWVNEELRALAHEWRTANKDLLGGFKPSTRVFSIS
jgi:hypothetical protein